MVTHALGTQREADSWLMGVRLCLRKDSSGPCTHAHTCAHGDDLAALPSVKFLRVCLLFLLLIHYFVCRCLKTLCSVMGTSWFVIPCLALETLS